MTQKIFLNIAHSYKNHQCVSARAIFTIKTSVTASKIMNRDGVVINTKEILKSLDFLAIPIQILELKIGVPSIFHRNINVIHRNYNFK